ncbi:MAG: BamA/TamA family outer membrane protein [Bacteroidales bacterium]|nr:BamA/TamA family outer membrane protein [Bacteroidales bacterium]MDD4385091.1 BamA/TamA family outer membrane protein [Bacteroidales bacterium]MDY0196402.1 BamA/TamA family outer membrane protein [Tenuifilaceae bacterium]
MLLLSATSCRITKNVPENEYLLDNANIKIEAKERKPGIKEGKLQNYIKQKPNKRVLLFRLHLRMYNLARKDKEKGLSKLLRTIGEEPVVLDTLQTNQSVGNLSRYIISKGYYDAVVSDTTIIKGQRATVNYKITIGNPYKVKRVNYVIEDTLIRNIVLRDTVSSLIPRGSRFDMDLLRQERIRIEKNLKENGYFLFSRDFITFTADTSLGRKRVDLDLVIRNRFIRTEFGDKIPQPYRKHVINNVFIYTGYDPVEYYYLEEDQLLDTVTFDNQNFIYTLSPGIKYKTLSDANLIRPGQIYSESIAQKTRDNLNSLRLYRAVNVFFRPDEEAERIAKQEESFLIFGDEDIAEGPPMGKLNCHIQLTPHTLQSYQIDLVGTNTASDIGVEGNLSFQHKNIFKGAEILDTKFRGMVQFLTGDNVFTNSVEVGGSVGLSFPRFLGPFTGKEFVKRYGPRTQFSLSYNYQRRPDYTRTLAGFNIGYSWRSENRFAHTFIPAELSVINIFSIDDNFLDRISNTYLANSYKNQLVTLSSYGLTYSNQSAQKRDYAVVRYNFEISGNTLKGIYSLFGKKAEDGTYQLFNTNFSQFVKSDINFVFNQQIDENNTIVYRLFAGAGLPYGNSKALPFEKKYFSGGSSGIRAWHARGLGPGTFVEEQLKVPNQTADIKIEANFEYRFKLFWMLEGALFLDAGNIWAISSADERVGAVFYPDTFYKQFALGTGTGIRMNLGFFIIRVDLGMKLHDPGIKLPSPDNPTQEIVNYNWLPFNKRYVFKDDFTIHFGIGYPF